MPTPPNNNLDADFAGPIAINLSDETTIQLIVSTNDDLYPFQTNIVEDPLASFVELFAKYMAATLPIVQDDPRFILMCDKLNLKIKLVNT